MSELAKGCHRAHPHDEPCGEPSEEPTKWVVSKYAPETGERFELLCEPVERESFYKVKSKIGDILYLYIAKSEYIPCPPPERWERVPIDYELRVINNGSALKKIHHDGYYYMNESEGFRFRIIDGALVLERRVS